MLSLRMAGAWSLVLALAFVPRLALAETKAVGDVTPATTYTTTVVIDQVTGLPVSLGGGGGGTAGTEYTEDAASLANPVGGTIECRRRDTLNAAEVSADLDWVTLNCTAKGQAHVFAELGAGGAIAGRFGTDQTTHGTTDQVAADLTKIAGTATATGNGVVSAGVQRVAVASDNTPIPTKIDQTTPGTTNGVVARTLSFSTACVQMTLPASGAAAYATGVLVGNSITAGSVTPIACTVGSYSGASIRVTKAQLRTSATTLTNAAFLVHLYTASPTIASGNGAAYSTTASGWFCTIPVTLGLAFSDAAAGQGTPATGGDCARVLSATAIIYALIQTNSAYTWANNETFDLTLEGLE